MKSAQNSLSDAVNVGGVVHSKHAGADQNYSPRVGPASQGETSTPLIQKKFSQVLTNDKLAALNKVSDAHSRFKPLGIELSHSRQQRIRNHKAAMAPTEMPGATDDSAQIPESM